MANVLVHDAALFLKLPRALKAEVRRVAEQRGIPMADLVRSALADVVARADTVPAPAPVEGGPQS